jgi:hypothetical protein
MIEFSQTALGGLEMVGMVSPGQFNPASKAHRMVEAVERLFVEISQVADNPQANTDGERYRALKDFGNMEKTNIERFNFVNEQLMAYEQERELAKLPHDQDLVADKVIELLKATEPTPGEVQADIARIEAAEEKRERKAEAIIERGSL